MIAVRLPKEMEQRLNMLAQETGRTKTFYVQKALEEHLDDLEDQYLAESIMARVSSGQERLYSQQEVEAMLGLDD